MTDISRWLSEATPPDDEPQEKPSHHGGMPEWHLIHHRNTESLECLLHETWSPVCHPSRMRQFMGNGLPVVSLRSTTG